MGSGIEVNCKSCNYTENIFFGRGIFQDQLSLARKRIIKQVEEFRIHNNIKEEILSLTLFYCNTCESFRNELYVELVSETGKTYTSKYFCNTCKKELELGCYSMIPDLKCPKCKEKKLEYFDGILWD